MTDTAHLHTSAIALNAQMRNDYVETGILNRDLDKQALEIYFQEDVNKHTQFFHSQKEKLKYLVDNGYYEKEFLLKYKEQDVLDLYQHLYNHKFRYQTFIAAKTFYNSYALKAFDGETILERYEDRVGTVALYLGNGNYKLAMELANDMIRGIYQPATPTFQNSGKKARGELVSCFLICLTDDLHSISRGVSSVGLLSKLGGGVGACVTNIRSRGAPIKGYPNRAKGVVPVVKAFENRALYADQLGVRKGQIAVYIHACHYDVLELLDARRPVDDSDVTYRLTDVKLGVVMPDIAYRLAAEKKDLAMFCPYDVKRVTGKPMTEISIDEWYWKLYNDPTVRRKYIDAEEFHNKLSALQGGSGYPYIVNESTVNRANPNPGRIAFSNLCSEILQPHELSELTWAMNYVHVGKDISCNLGSLNVANLFKHGEDFEKSVFNSISSLTQVSLFSDIRDVPSIARGNTESHAVGLGVMNYHGFLASKNIRYGSDASVEFTDWFFSTLRYYSLKASNRLAKKYNYSYVGFKESTYASGQALLGYTDRDPSTISPEIKAIFDDANIHVPNGDEWRELSNAIRTGGLFNAYVCAVAPTGNISYAANATPSMAPITSRIEGRQNGSIGTVYFPMPFLTQDNKHLFPTAYELDPEEILRVYAAATPHVDQGISCTLYGTHSTTISQLNGIRNKAWLMGLKTLYYVRMLNDGDIPTSSNSTLKTEIKAFDECEACAI